MRVLTLVLVSAATLTSLACGSTCGDYESALNRCGQSFNRSKCDQNIAQCSADDQRTIENASQCANNSAVCANGSIVDGIKYAACVAPVLSVSSACQGAVF